MARQTTGSGATFLPREAAARRDSHRPTARKRRSASDGFGAREQAAAVQAHHFAELLSRCTQIFRAEDVGDAFDVVLVVGGKGYSLENPRCLA